MNNDTLYSLALQRITMNMPQVAIALYRAAGTAGEVYAHRSDVKALVPDATQHLCDIIATAEWDQLLQWAEKEMEWAQKKNIRLLTPADAAYPQRLHDCFDAPMVLAYLGNADLNAPHAVSIVGTRQATPYADDFIKRLTADLKRMVPDVLIVSGLAYGVDVMAHRAALQQQLDTVGVLAHGLDTMYPASHRSTAVEMVHHGGLLTEYPSQTRGDRQNFLRRNRIVAGMTDCTIVVESKEHGGSLVTARIASDYGREVFAVPGRVGDATSEGCNALIYDRKATILLSASNITTELGWHTEQERQRQLHDGIQTTAFPQLTDEQQCIVNLLRRGDLHQNVIVNEAHLPVSRVSSLLFEMEMMGIVKSLAGGMYHLIS